MNWAQCLRFLSRQVPAGGQQSQVWRKPEAGQAASVYWDPVSSQVPGDSALRRGEFSGEVPLGTSFLFISPLLGRPDLRVQAHRMPVQSPLSWVLCPVSASGRSLAPFSRLPLHLWPSCLFTYRNQCAGGWGRRGVNSACTHVCSMSPTFTRGDRHHPSGGVPRNSWLSPSSSTQGPKHKHTLGTKRLQRTLGSLTLASKLHLPTWRISRS